MASTGANPGFTRRRHIGVEFRNRSTGAGAMRAIWQSTGIFWATLALLAGFAQASLGQSTPATAQATSAASQSTATAPHATSPDTDLAAGTTICGELANSIDAKKAKSGDAIVARVTLPVLAHGKVLIPNDAKIAGHVVWAKTRSGTNDESEIGIVFDRAVLKDGSELPLSLTVQAIGRGTRSAAELASQQPPYDPDVPLGPGIPGSPASTPRQPGLQSPRSQPLSPPKSLHPDVDPEDSPHPVLDGGSHGAIGLPDLTLTESSDAASGSVVRSQKKNVKLESGTEIVLRVIGTPGGEPKQ